MHPKRKQKLILVCLMVGAVGIALTFVLRAFNQNLQLFFSPSEVIDGLTVEFALTDNGETIPVRYTGILPDLFREGQGTISVGKLDEEGVFIANKVLAKHDENYMPPEVADALNKQKEKQSAKHGADTVQLQ